MDHEIGKFWLEALQLAFTAAVGFYAWLTKRHAVNATAIDAVRKDLADLDQAANDRIDECDNRLTRIETTMNHVATRADLEQLSGHVSTLRAELRGVSEAATDTRRMCRRIEDFLSGLARDNMGAKQ